MKKRTINEFKRIIMNTLRKQNSVKIETLDKKYNEWYDFDSYDNIIAAAEKLEAEGKVKLARKKRPFYEPSITKIMRKEAIT